MTTPAAPTPLTEAHARALDAADPLRGCRGLFNLPSMLAASDPHAAIETADAGPRAVYLTGNSLGCQPKAAREAVTSELDDWARLGVEGHTHGRNPWLPYHELFRHTGARLVGARPGEVVMMNTLTVNLHLLMVSFYRPRPGRDKILIEGTAFPSDSYAVYTHAQSRGVDPEKAIVRLQPEGGSGWVLTTDDVLGAIDRHGASTALVMLGGVNYLSGQWFDMPAITAAAKRAGCVVGWDLAHAAGNLPLELHDWDVDFAAWCSYKYLNGGPGAVAGAFVHERHGRDASLPRYAGWWGNDPETRFAMRPEFVPRQGADGWQCSNPPILSLAPLRASLEIFDRVGMKSLRDKSLKLTAYLEAQIDAVNRDFAGGSEPPIRVITPRDPSRRGCQLSMTYARDPRGLLDRLKRAGVIADFREPNIVRVAPVPLYNTFHDCWSLARVLRESLGADMLGAHA